MRSGVRWAETTLASHFTPRASRLSAAPFSVGQSERLPMIMATGALAPMRDPPGPNGGPSRKGGEYRRQRLYRNPGRLEGRRRFQDHRFSVTFRAMPKAQDIDADPELLR